MVTHMLPMAQMRWNGTARKRLFVTGNYRRIGAGKNRLALTVLPVTVALVSGRILKMLQKQELLAHIP